MELYTVVISALAGLIPAYLVYLNTRREIKSSEASRTLEGVLRVLDEYQEIAQSGQVRIKELQADFDQYKAKTDEALRSYKKELKSQEAKIEEVNARLLKYQLILSIYLHQMKQQAIEPLIGPEVWESITIPELRLIADSLSNIEKRRNE